MRHNFKRYTMERHGHSILSWINTGCRCYLLRARHLHAIVPPVPVILIHMVAITHDAKEAPVLYDTPSSHQTYTTLKLLNSSTSEYD